MAIINHWLASQKLLSFSEQPKSTWRPFTNSLDLLASWKIIGPVALSVTQENSRTHQPSKSERQTSVRCYRKFIRMENLIISWKVPDNTLYHTDSELQRILQNDRSPTCIHHCMRLRRRDPRSCSNSRRSRSSVDSVRHIGLQCLPTERTEVDY